MAVAECTCDRKLRKTAYIFGEINISVIFDNDGNAWIKAIDLARALGFEKENVYLKIDKKYCKSYNDLVYNYDSCKNCQSQNIYFNEAGAFIFILRSCKLKAKEFADWLHMRVISKTRYLQMTPEDEKFLQLRTTFLLYKRWMKRK